MDSVPPGFERQFRQSPVTDPWEPLYSKRDGNMFFLGLRIATQHCNTRGILHGGVISTVADNALGLSCVAQAQGMSAFTIQLSTDFLSVGQLGRWLEVRAAPNKVGSSIAFANASVFADETLMGKNPEHRFAFIQENAARVEEDAIDA